MNRCEQHGFETTTRKVRKVSKVWGVQGVQGVQGLSLSPRFAGWPNVSSLSEPFWGLRQPCTHGLQEKCEALQRGVNMSDGTDVMPLASITSRLPIWVHGEFFGLLKVWCYPKTPCTPSVENKVKKALPFVPSVVKLSLNFSTLQPFQWVVYSVAISPLAGSLKNLILDVPFSLAISGLKSSSYSQLPFQPLKTKCHKNHLKKKKNSFLGKIAVPWWA